MFQDESSKVCIVCGETKPATVDFFKADGRFLRTGKTVLLDTCLACRKMSGAIRARRYRTNKILDDANTYYNNKNIQAASYREKNRESIADRQHEYYQRNKEVINNNRRKTPREEKYKQEITFYKKHPFKLKAKKVNHKARVRGAVGKISDIDIINKLKEQNEKCYYCGCELKEDYHIDHKTPICRGGLNIKDNICCSCPACNLSKNDKTVEEFVIVKNRRCYDSV